MNTESGTPTLALGLYAVGILEIIGGIVLCAKLWLGEPTTGYYWKFSAYTPALTWLFAGIVSALFLFAAVVLTYLKDIHDNLSG